MLQDCRSFPAILLLNADRFAERPANRFKTRGIWHTWTWREVADEVRALAFGLRELGFRSGDRIAIVGRNRPRLYWAITAAQSLGGVAVPVYHDSVADEMAYVLGHAEVGFVMAEDQEQVDKILSLADRLPSLRHTLYDEPRGLRDYDHERLHHLDTVLTNGRAALERDPAGDGTWRAGIAAIRSEDLAVLLYTSGTTGRPKGVMLTYQNLISSAVNANRFDRLDETDEVVAYLPMAWIGDHIFSLAQSYCAGYCVCCPEAPDTIAQDRHEIAPTYFFAPPRIFEEMLTMMMVRIEDAMPIKRRMFHYFVAVARRCGAAADAGAAVPLTDRLLYGLGSILVYRPIKNRLGLSRIKVAYTAGEAIGPEMFGFFRSFGVNLKQLYGQTEACVYITMHPDDAVDVETVGIPAPGVDIRITEQGEIQFRSPGVFAGYYKEPERTDEIRTLDGWVKTGDAGYLDDRGHLRIIDRAKDVGRLTGGGLFAPKYIENKLKFFPEIKEAVAFGHDRDHGVAMINIDLAAVGNWAERNGVIYASYQELAAHPQVYDIVARHVAAVNRSLAADPRMAASQIRRFLILHKELDADDGELTRTQKVRRSFIAERYAPLVDALYTGPGVYEIATEVVFEDGRKGLVSGRVQVREAEIVAPPAGPASVARAA
ncbi:AMP-binding protein [Rhodoplanes serenus]|uniref:AMP-binding protein n=1 Tax=Rhodoplanes serenus TaxID=200615 RepID=A0A9X5AQM0_9BRAD|nr:AMP-binding protein [Rhodoplanes serenus]MTW15211.1 AMP-binding protein [Rhodoplanes serenus]